MSSPSAPVVRVQDVHLAFGEKRVLRGVDLEVHKGENYVIIGPSGCGKSVLLRLIFGLLKPDAGRIEIFGTDIVPLSDEEMMPLRQRMAMVFQEGALFHSMTAEENIGLALGEVKNYPPEKIREMVKEKLHLVGLDGAQERNVGELSGGMKKRLAIARALALEPEILFYDEPTTGLDPPLADAVDELIYSLSRSPENCTITVTHDMTAAKYFGDRIGFLQEGRISLERRAEEIDESDDALLQSFLHRKEHHSEG